MWGWAPVSKTWFPEFFRPIVAIPTSSYWRVPYRLPVQRYDGERLPGLRSRLAAIPCLPLCQYRSGAAVPFPRLPLGLAVGIVNVLDRANPNVVNNDANSPQFLLFGRGQPRAVNVRLRFLGKK